MKNEIKIRKVFCMVSMSNNTKKTIQFFANILKATIRQFGKIQEELDLYANMLYRTQFHQVVIHQDVYFSLTSFVLVLVEKEN